MPGKPVVSGGPPLPAFASAFGIPRNPDGLGDFLELEVVLRPGQDSAEGQAIAAELMGRLGVRADDLCATAYADMLEGSMAGQACRTAHARR